jgi:hypothetical protein
MSQIGFTDLLTSLATGTQIWVDLAVLTGSASDAVNLQNVSVTFAEMLS